MNGRPSRRNGDFARKALVAVGIALLAVAGAVVAWQTAHVLLVVFAGVLFAIFLRGLAEALSARTRLSPGWALTAVVVTLVGALGAGGWLLAGDIAAQLDQLARDLPRALQSFRDTISRYEWGRALVAATPSIEDVMTGDVVARTTGVASRTLGVTVGAIVNLVIVVFVGIYVAADPGLYARGIVRLVPPARRERTGEVLGALRDTLQAWLIGKVAVMTLVGVLTGLGLWLLGLPLALTLGLLAGLLEFIPYFGPVLAFGPAVLLALTQSPTLALYVGALYVVVQSLESYVFTPLVQQRAVALPPALTIAAQILLSVLFGALGLLLASPLTAAAFVLVKMLYVEDVLGDRLDVPGEHDAGRRRRSA